MNSFHGRSGLPFDQDGLADGAALLVERNSVHFRLAGLWDPEDQEVHDLGFVMEGTS